MSLGSIAAVVVTLVAPPGVGVTPSDAVVVPEPSDPIGTALAGVEGGLTAQFVAEHAVASAPTVVANDADLRVAAAKVDQTIVAFLPQVQLKAGYTRLSDVKVTFGSGALVGAANPGLLGLGPCPAGAPGQCVVDAGGGPVVAAAFDIPQVLNQFSTQAMLSVPLSDYVFRIFSGLKAAKHAVSGAEYAVEAEKQRVAVDARVAYYNWVRAVASVAVSKDAVTTTQARLNDAKVTHRVGMLTDADLVRIEALVAGAQGNVIQAEAFEELARENLAVIMGVASEDWTVGEPISDTGNAAPPHPKLQVLVSRALVRRYELRSLDANLDAIDSGIKTERAGAYPRLDAFAETTYANPNQRIFPATREWNATWSAGLQLTWTINGALAMHTKRKELQAQRDGLKANVESLRRGIRLEVTSAFVDRKRAMASIALADKMREAAEVGYRAVAAQLLAGDATATDVISAQGDRLTAQLQAINARIDLRVADTKIAYATGATNKS